MPDDETGESWQIIPYEDDEVKLQELAANAPPAISTSPPTPIAKPIPPPPSTPTPVMTTASSESPQILELKNMLLQYPAGSLERTAIEEEIKRLQKS